ncbi:MAG: hypothetical protein AAFX78_12590 [Cyanobacteria bacterium J06638_20]
MQSIPKIIKLLLKMVTSNIRHLRPDKPGYLDVGLLTDLVVLDFHKPHLRASHYLITSILTRVTPDDVLLTLRQGQPPYQSSEFVSTQTAAI